MSGTGRACLNKFVTKWFMDILSRLKSLIENEARSCSMDMGCITSNYVYRMWGGEVAIEEIEAALPLSKKELGL